MPRPADTRTPDLFSVPSAPREAPGALNVGIELRHVLSAVLKTTPKSRFEVAARMSELLGVEVSKNQLDAWTAESREGWRFPLEYVLAFEVACESRALTEWLAERRGCRVLVGRDALFAELGRIEHHEAQLREQRRRLKRALDDSDA